MSDILRTIRVLEQLEALDFASANWVWNEAKEQYMAVTDDRRQVKVIDCFENALDLHKVRKDAGYG